MSKLDDFLSKLRTTITNTQTAKIDKALDKAVKDITLYKSQSGRNGYIDLIKSLISKTSFGLDNISGTTSQGLTPAAFGQSSRVMRYKTYEAIVYHINYMHRALSVFVDNILSPDDITKVVLEVKPKTYLEDETPTETKAKHVKQIIKATKIEEKLHLVVRNTLLYGDLLCEIADPKTTLTSRTILAESARYNEYLIKKTSEGLIDIISVPVETLKGKKQELKIKIDMSSLESEFQEKMDLINTENSEKSKEKEKKEKERLKELSNLSIVFHLPQHVIKLQSTMFPICFGYLIFPAIYVNPSAKVLIALETALAIQRLSRSTEKRKIGIEIGLPRDAKKAVELMKEQFRKRKISLDSFGTVDTIPSMITTFEDVYIPQKDGKAFVDINTFNEGGIDVRGKVDELKFMRDQLVASVGIPPSFIGIEENLSNKAALSEENIIFARAVIAHQKYLTHQIRGLIQQIYNIIDPESALSILDNVDISFPTPRSLQYERESRYTGEMANLIDTLDRIGIPKDYSRKKYLPQVEWDEVEKYETQTKIDKITDPDKKAEEEGGMGGFGGGGMGGVGGGMGF